MVIHLVFNGFILLKITNVKQIHYITPIWFWGSLHYIVGNTIQFLFWQKMNIGMIIVGGERVFTGLGSISCSILSILQTRGWLYRIGQYQLSSSLGIGPVISKWFLLSGEAHLPWVYGVLLTSYWRTYCICVISSKPSCKYGNVWFTLVPVKALSDQVLIGY